MKLPVCRLMHLPIRPATAVLLAGLTVWGCSAQRSEQYRQEGDMYLSSRDLAKAEEAYRSATQANPDNAKAYLGLGQCQVASGKLEDALTAFQKAISLAPGDSLGYLRAANTQLALNQDAAAESTAGDLAKVNPERGGVLLASVQLRTGRRDEALKTLEGLQPQSLLVATHLAYCQLAGGDAAQAEATLDKAMKQSAVPAVGAKMLQVDVLAALGRVSEITQKPGALEGQDPDEAMVAAHALVKAQRQEEGESEIGKALEQNAASGWANYAQASYLLEAGKASDAARYLELADEALPWEAVVMYATMTPQGMTMASTPRPAPGAASPPKSGEAPETSPQQPEDWQTLWKEAALGRLLQDRQRFLAEGGENLQATLVLAAHFHGDNKLAEELAAGLPADSPLSGFMSALKDRKLQEALDALKPWNDKDGPLQILSMNATAYALALGQARNQAVQVLTACYTKYPENVVSLYNLAQVFLAAGMPQFSIPAFRRIAAIYPENLEAHLSLVRALRQFGKPEEARQAAETMYTLFPDSRDAVLTACGTYVDNKDLEAAQRVLDVYLQAHPGEPAVELTRASVQFCQGHPDEALKVLEGISAKDPIAAGVTTLASLCHAALGQWDQVIAGAGSSDQQTLALPARLVLVAAYAKKDKKDQAIAALTQPGAKEPYAGRLGAVIIKALGGTAESLSDTENALSQALATNPGALVDFACGAAFQEAKLQDEAYQAYTRVDAALPEGNDIVLNLMFGSLANAARVQDVKQQAQSIAEKHAKDSRAWLGCAAIMQRLGDTAGERAALDKAAAADPNNAAVYLARGDYFSRQKDVEAAIGEYRHFVQLRPDDPVGNNNLAFSLLLAGKDPKEAMQCAEIAAKALPRDAHVLDTLGVAQLRAGDLEKSKTSLMAALQLRPGDPSILLDYGQLLIALGDIQAGRENIQSALNSSKALGLDFDRKDEAEKILSEHPAPPGASGAVGQATKGSTV